jgi:signal transduction histidine kinase
MDRAFLLQLLEISRRMSETRELNPLLQYTMRQALDVMNGERGYLVLTNDENALDFRVKVDRDGCELEHPEAQISNSILNKVVRTGQPLLINDAILDPSFKASDSVRSLQLRSVLCAPLMMGGTVRGAIYIENRSGGNIFEDKQIEPMSFFAAQAAVAIENAVLNEDLESQVAARTVELEAANQQLEQAWSEAVEANRLQTLLLGNVAHDLRSPIGTATTILRSINEGTYGNLESAQADWLKRAVTALNHAVNLVDDIFDLTRAEAGKLDIYKDAIDLTRFLNEVFAIAQGMPWAQAVTLVDEVPQDLPKVMVDPTRIRQVLINLLTNAQKFTKKGNVTLYAKLQPNEQCVLIGVRDTGAGIPDDFKARMFQRFQQGSNDVEQRRRGTGLGLAISRELVERHGGHIGVTSREGQGADVFFTLPV